MAGTQTPRQVVLPRSITSVAKSKTYESATSSGDDITNPDRNTWGVRDPRVLRTTGQTTEAIRILAKENGLFSTAIFNMVQVAMSGYTVTGYVNGTNEFSSEGTQLGQTIIENISVLSDYTRGFAKKRGLDSIVQTMLREVVITGGVAAELVLDKARYPDRIQPVDYANLKWKSDGKGSRYPAQTGTDGNEVILNIPTFSAESLHQETNTSYATSMLRAALGATFDVDEFNADAKKALFRVGHSRLVATLDAEMIRATAPPEIAKDPKKLAAYMSSVKTEVETALETIEPDDAVVSFNSVTFDTSDIGGVKSDYTPLMAQYNNNMATATKTPPSILGIRGAGSQSVSNTESLIFLKTCKSLQVPIEAVMSRLLTLAARLYGAEVYLKFKFNDIDLRPKAELQSFRTMRETSIYQQLSWGMISDELAHHLLGIPPSQTATPLSGTGFYDSSGTTEADPINDGGAERNLNPETPKKAGGTSQ